MTALQFKFVENIRKIEQKLYLGFFVYEEITSGAHLFLESSVGGAAFQISNSPHMSCLRLRSERKPIDGAENR